MVNPVQYLLNAFRAQNERDGYVLGYKEGSGWDGRSLSDMDIADTSHAATHEDGGADEMDIESMATTDTTTTNVLSPDGSGGVAFGVVPAHASRHQSGGADAIKLDDLAAPDDNTDLNASTSAHGLLPKLSNDSSQFLDGTGAFSTPGGSIDRQSFTSSDTWSKPSSGTVAFVQAWGGGGSGGKGSTNDNGGGGGGGGYAEAWFLLSDLGSSETVTIGAGGTSQTTGDADGNTGSNTTFGSHLTAYGGGGGGGAGGGDTGAGGGGGGLMSAGNDASTTTFGVGGSPNLHSSTGAADNHFGGANGGNTSSDNGGLAVWGGGGGGTGNVSTDGGDGGGSYNGGGGGGGANSGVGDPGAGGTSINGGNGGAGATGADNATAGTQPGGGGGGSVTGDSGAGGAGQVIVVVF